ncbi:MAG: calcium-binding protein [Solirubrobacteraceae bacterium]|nr:calcium-binding protein [Solirubrobacteraceae bacterium]
MRKPVAACAALATVLGMPAVAGAAPIDIVYDPAAGVRITGSSGPDQVFVALGGTEAAPEIRVENRLDAITTTTGCLAEPRIVRCPIPVGGSRLVTVSLLDGPDRLEAAGLDVTGDMGAGDDRVRQSANRTTLTLGPGDDAGGLGPGGGSLAGGAGRDAIGGGPGADALSGDEGDDRLLGSPGPDTIAGGPGTDRVDYRGLMTASGPLPSILLRLDAGATVKRVGTSLAPSVGTDSLSGLEGAVGTPRDDEIASRDGEPATVECGAGADKLDLDLRDKVSDVQACERSARGAVKERPNVVLGTGRFASGGSALRVTLRCPKAVQRLGCRGRLTASRGGARGRPTSYRVKAGAGRTLRVTVPSSASKGPTVVTSVERGLRGRRTTIRVYGIKARAAQQGNDLPQLGATGDDVGPLRVTCGGIDRYVVGFSGRSSVKTALVGGGVDGVRAIQPLCATMTEDGGLTAPVAGDTLGERFGGDGLFNVRAPEWTERCKLDEPLRGTERPGVATGVWAEIAERSDPIYIRRAGLECSFAGNLDPLLNDIGSAVTAVEEDERIDGESTCPTGMAVTGLTAGGDRLGRVGDLVSYGAICGVFPRPPRAPESLQPRAGDTITPTSTERFTWRRIAAVYNVCIAGASPARCARTTNPFLPVTELLRGSDAGSRIRWTVRACAAAQLGAAPDRACGPTASSPSADTPIAAAVRVAPRPPSPNSSSRPRALGASRSITLRVGFRGGLFADAHRLEGYVDDDTAVERRVPENPTAAGGVRSEDVTFTVPAGRHVVRATARACAGDPSLPQTATRAEVCGDRVELVRFLVDGGGNVCPAAGPLPKACPTSSGAESVAGERG